MRLYVVASLAVVCFLACSITQPADAYITAYPGQPDIDGILETVGLAIARWLADQIPIHQISDLINAILDAWVVHEHKVNYWENVENNVKETCGKFINQQNIDEVIQYKSDVQTMLETYKNSPVHGDGTYPDKNTQADAITTSIINKRYLVEAAVEPWSMSLHFVDIASVHIMILKDAAESYSFPNQKPSQWWQDVSNEIAHYDEYTEHLHNTTVGFRQNEILCSIKKGFEDDTYTMTDRVTGRTDKCVQKHNTGSCSNACEMFQEETVVAYNKWYGSFVARPLAAWRVLKKKADSMASIASNKRNPLE